MTTTDLTTLKKQVKKNCIGYGSSFGWSWESRKT